MLAAAIAPHMLDQKLPIPQGLEETIELAMEAHGFGRDPFSSARNVILNTLSQWVMDLPEDLQASTPLMEITIFDHRLGSWCAAHCAQTAVHLIPPEVEAPAHAIALVKQWVIDSASEPREFNDIFDVVAMRNVRDVEDRFNRERLAAEGREPLDRVYPYWVREYAAMSASMAVETAYRNPYADPPSEGWPPELADTCMRQAAAALTVQKEESPNVDITNTLLKLREVVIGAIWSFPLALRIPPARVMR
jgi:hypothetical protein